MFKLSFWKNLVVGSSFASALFHFVCCGLPILAVISGGLLGMEAFPQITFLTHAQIGWLLVFSGLLLALSFYISYSNKCACNPAEKNSVCRIILYVSLLLYLPALYFHIWPIESAIPHDMSSHTEMNMPHNAH